MRATSAMLVVANIAERITHPHAICQQKPLTEICGIVYTFMLSYIYQVLEKGLKKMDNQTLDNEKTTQHESASKLNLALFFGLCVIAISILIVGFFIARRIPQTLHGNFSGMLMDGSVAVREFMTDEWEVAGFIGIWEEDLIALIESGELDGTFTVFEVERTVFDFDFDRWALESDEPIQVPAPTINEGETTTEYLRVFSRERLKDWLLARMDS